MRVAEPSVKKKTVSVIQKIIEEGKHKGIFFSDDGLVDSNRLRKHLWTRLHANPAVVFRTDSEICGLNVSSQNDCQGFVLKNDERLSADVTILAMGLVNKYLLASQNIDLPLWSVWGAALKGTIKDVE